MYIVMLFGISLETIMFLGYYHFVCLLFVLLHTLGGLHQVAFVLISLVLS